MVGNSGREEDRVEVHGAASGWKCRLTSSSLRRSTWNWLFVYQEPVGKSLAFTSSEHRL